MSLKEQLEDTNVVIRSRQSKKNWHCNGQQTKRQADTQWCANTMQKHTDRAKTGNELMCPGRINNYCPTCDICRVTLVTNLMISHQWGKDHIMTTTNGTWSLSFVTQLSRKINQDMLATVNRSMWWLIH
jgi:hypothetical protein